MAAKDNDKATSKFWALRVSGGATMFFAYDVPTTLEAAKAHYRSNLGATLITADALGKEIDGQPTWPIVEALANDPKHDGSVKVQSRSVGHFFDINYLHSPPRPNNCYDYREFPEWNGEPDVETMEPTDSEIKNVYEDGDLSWVDMISSEEDIRSFRNKGGWYVFPDGWKDRSFKKAQAHIEEVRELAETETETVME